MQFSDLNLTTPLLEALDEMGLIHPTTIQEKTFNVILSGKDVCGIAQTGTGKTLAYLLPILRMMNFTKSRFPQVLILVPTRELVAQVVQMAQRLCAKRNMVIVGVFGGVNMKPQADAVTNGCDIIVGTPGRLYDLMVNGFLSPKMIKKLVIDEVDEMMNLGFRTQLVNIFEMLPERRQNLLFSATLHPDVNAIIDEYFDVPIRVEAAPAGTPLAQIDQSAYEVPNFYTKVNLLKHLLTNTPSLQKALIFTDSKKMADRLYDALGDEWQELIGVIHSNKDQRHRFNVVNRLKDGTYKIVIATDIVARGIDIAKVDHVINFDIPDVAEDYIHRIGRTGRAQENGTAISFITPKDESKIAAIQKLMQMDIPLISFPEEVESSTVLIPEEEPVVYHKEIQVKIKKRDDVGPAFHEKKPKNNRQPEKKISYKDKMMQKYGKPKTRGSKGKKR